MIKISLLEFLKLVYERKYRTERESGIMLSRDVLGLFIDNVMVEVSLILFKTCM